MMKRLMQFTIVSFAAGLCLSAQMSPKKPAEAAASNEIKESSEAKKCEEAPVARSAESDCYQGDQSDASGEVKRERRSAAHKVIYGR